MAICLGLLVVGASQLRNQAEFGLLGAATLAIAWLVDVTFTPALCWRMLRKT
jgi:multidrug efflux pump subunit AcrB